MNIVEELSARGLVQEVNDREGLSKLLADAPVTFYCGFDSSGRRFTSATWSR